MDTIIKLYKTVVHSYYKCFAPQVRNPFLKNNSDFRNSSMQINEDEQRAQKIKLWRKTELNVY